MNSLLQTFTRSFSRGSQPPPNAGATQGRNDLEADGFLLVGDTASERTAVHGSTFQADKIDAPPQYGHVAQNSLPSYQEYTSNTHLSPTLDVSKHPDLPHRNPFQTGSTTVPARSQNHPEQGVNPTFAGFTDPNSNTTPLSGVPFQLGNGCDLGFVYSDLRNSSMLQQRTFDWSLYDYDFNLEKSFLSEHEQRDGELMDVAY